jgi:hypothetical protein
MNMTALSESEKGRQLREKVEQYLDMIDPITKEFVKVHNSFIPKMIFNRTTGELKTEYPPEYHEYKAKYQAICESIHAQIFG